MHPAYTTFKNAHTPAVTEPDKGTRVASGVVLSISTTGAVNVANKKTADSGQKQH